jgi:CheY-like chemotaxis protein
MFTALLVDDEEPIRGMLAKLLERDGFRVVTAESAASGIARLAEDIDCVVTDLRMETPLAGFEVVKAARRMARRPVIVVLTAFPVPGSEWRSAGADALIVKGVKCSAIPKQLKALLAKRAAV